MGKTMISQWRLPDELGGGVVNPVKENTNDNTYKVKVPGTPWTIIVPGECLKAMLPDEPPVKSMVLVMKGQGWQVFKRLFSGINGWVQPGYTDVVSWRALHESWDKVHVLLWWDAEVVGEGVSIPGARGPHPMVVQETNDDEPGVAAVRIADGLGTYGFLGHDEAIRAAAALLGLALKGRMS